MARWHVSRLDHLRYIAKAAYLPISRYRKSRRATGDPVAAAQRATWFHDHSDGHRRPILVAEETPGKIAGYTATGRFRAKQAYVPTVEVTIQYRPDATHRGIGTALWISR